MQLNEAPQAVKQIAQDQDKINHLDVRPTLRAGGEPFSEIMAMIGRTTPDGALRLRATFEPKPLFRVLGNQGWSHWVEFGQGEDWIVWFYRDSGPNDGSHEECPKKLTADLTELLREYPELRSRLDTKEKGLWIVDVRHLSPPEPMELTLAALEKLPSHASLVQVNERVPQLLLPILQERGFEHRILEVGQEVRIQIRKRD